MIRRILPGLVFSIGLLSAGLPASAQDSAPFPGLTASFATPTGTGRPTASFDVYVRLSLAAGSNNFTFDGSNPTAFGLPASFVFPDIANLTSAFLDASFTCNGTFTNICDPGAYTFTFNTGPTSFAGVDQLNITAGSYGDFLFGTFAPTGGFAALGTYTFYNAALLVAFDGNDGAGNDLSADIILAETCPTYEVTCAFTRTVITDGVTVTPEPATVGFMVFGLGALGIVAHRRRNLA